MSRYLTTKAYGDCIGPFGFAMRSATAKAVEAALKQQPAALRDRFKATVGGQTVAGFARKVLVPKGLDLVDGERADVSIITADGVDHDGDVVLPGGGVFDTFRANPVVPWCHDYSVPPVGRAEWITATAIGDGGKGLKAKTRYTPRPKDFPAGVEWAPDTIWGFVQAGDIKGKSIGFIPLSIRSATPDELKGRPDWKDAELVDRWLMLEYSVCPIPCQPQSLVDSVAKMRTKGLAVPPAFLAANGVVLPEVTPSVAEVERITSKGTPASVAFKGLTAQADADPLASRYTQYLQDGSSFIPIGDANLGDALPKHAYRICLDPWTDDVTFESFAPVTDDLVKFKDSVMSDVLSEIDRFWGLKADYDRLGLMHNRGMILYGPPGTGKTCILHQTAEMIVRRGDVVLYGKSIPAVAAGLAAFRAVEPDRKAVVVLEDADEYIDYQQREFLQLLDGEKSIDGVLYLATTNYIDSFPPRLLRPGRFDKRVFVGPPDYDARLAYLTAKVVDTKSGTAEDVQRLAGKTDGLSFGDLRELVVAIYALREPEDEALARLRGAYDGRVKAWRGKVAELRKKDMDEAVGTDGGDAVAPSCPKCLTSEGMTGDDDGYACSKCGGRFIPKDDGGMDEVTDAKSVTAPAPPAAPAPAPAAVTPPPAEPPAPALTPTPTPAAAPAAPPELKTFVRPETIQRAKAAKVAAANAVAAKAVRDQLSDELHRLLGTP